MMKPPSEFTTAFTTHTATNTHHDILYFRYSDRWLWEESALGSSGENMCFDPLGTHTRAFVTDVRPKLFDGGWKGNVGGADFLTGYFDGSGVFQCVWVGC